ADATDAELLALDITGFDKTDILGSNLSTSSVETNLSLITSFANGTTVTYSSSDTSLITDAGVVTQPSFTNGDKPVVITATATNGTASETFTFSFTVAHADATDAELLYGALNSFSVANILQSNPHETSIIEDLYLIPTWSSSSVTWSSSNSAIISNSGVVTRPAYGNGDAQVTLTATLTVGADKGIREFTFTVLEMEATDADLLTEAVNELTVGDLLNGNPDASNITTNLYLPDNLSNGVAILWNGNSYISTAGTINRPSYTQGDAANVQLSAQLISGSDVEYVYFTFTILALEATDAELLAETVDAYAIQETLNGNADSSNIYSDLTLATALGNNVTVTWSSSNNGYITDTGAVVGQPDADSGDATVTLTGTAWLNSESYAITFDYIIKAGGKAQVTVGHTYNANVEIYEVLDPDNPSGYSNYTTPVATATTVEDVNDYTNSGQFYYSTQVIDSTKMYLVMVYGGTVEDYGYNGEVNSENVGNFFAIVDCETMLNGGFTVNELTDIAYRNISYMLAAKMTYTEIKASLDAVSAGLFNSDLDGDSTNDYGDLLLFDPYNNISGLAIGSVIFTDYSTYLIDNALYPYYYTFLNTNKVGSTQLKDHFSAMTISGSTLFGFTTGGFLETYNVSDMTAPIDYGTNLYFGQSGISDIAAVGNYLYTLNGSSLVTVDVSNVANISNDTYSSYYFSNTASDMAVDPDS
ncbi:MAG: hypothetical protein C0602_10260, partial [Denitrovibrio sp.]